MINHILYILDAVVATYSTYVSFVVVVVYFCIVVYTNLLYFVINWNYTCLIHF